MNAAEQTVAPDCGGITIFRGSTFAEPPQQVNGSVRRQEHPVDEQRKYAYRYLLYWAMLDIRPLGWLCWGWFRAWNPFYWKREGRRIRCAGAIADWLHNLALFSSLNFERFNEEWFWRDFESLRSRYPEFGLERYRNLFEQRLAEPLESESAEPGAAADGGGR